MAPSDSFRRLWQQQLRRVTGSAFPTWDLRKRLLATVGYTPNQKQEEMHQGLVTLPTGMTLPSKRKATSGGIQSGKSLWTAAEIFSLIPWLAPRPIFLVGPDFDQPRAEMKYLFTWLTQAGLLDPNRAIMPGSTHERWVFPLETGSTIQTYSATMPQKIAGSSPGLIAIVEAGQVNYDTYTTCRARITPGDKDSGGGWLILNGTLENSREEWYFDLLDLWQRKPSPQGVAYEQPTWSNTHEYPQGRHDQRFRDAENDPTLPRSVFLARFAGQRTKPAGLVWPQFDSVEHLRPIHVGKPCGDCSPDHVVLPATVAVDLAVDPGHGHNAAVLACVEHNRTLYVLDEICQTGWRPSAFIAEARRRWWWDLAVRGRRVVMDIAGKQVHGEVTWRDQWEASPDRGGAGLAVYMQKVPELEGRERVAGLMELGKILVDPRCTQLRYEITKGWRWLVDGTSQKPVGVKPLERDNDACKALIYLVYALFGALPGKKRPGPRVTVRPMTFLEDVSA
jgi:hypothetical protein